MENKPSPPTMQAAEAKAKTVITTIVVIAIAAWYFWPSDEPPKPVAEKESKFDAVFDSRTFVEKQLKAPATAKFDGGTENTQQIDDSTFLVKSFVDSQNSFGALLRSNYSCKIIYHKNTDMVSCKELVIQ